MAEESSFELFGTVEAECGKVTDSQEELLRDLAFIASDDTGGLVVQTVLDTRPGDHNSHHREEEVSPPPEAILPRSRRIKTRVSTKMKTRSSTRMKTTISTMMKTRAWRMKTRALKRKSLLQERESPMAKKLRAAAVVASDESTQEPEEGDVGKDRFMESPMVPMIGESAIPQSSSKPATEGGIIDLRNRRKLPQSILSVEGGEVGISAGSSTRIPSRSQPEVLNGNAGKLHEPAQEGIPQSDTPSPKDTIGSSKPTTEGDKTFLDKIFAIMVEHSKKHTSRFEGMDILEVAAMKGLSFPPPKWWRPGGYDP